MVSTGLTNCGFWMVGGFIWNGIIILGQFFYFDRYLQREIEDWFKDPFICRAVEWFQGRGERA